MATQHLAGKSRQHASFAHDNARRHGKTSFNQRRSHLGPRTIGKPEIYELSINRMETFGNPDGALPQQVTLLRINPGNPGSDLLFMDHIPVPREAWSYDSHDKILRWQGAFGGGQLHINHKTQGAVGVIGHSANAVSVNATATANFSCDVALNCGASYITSGGSVVGFQWDINSAEWKNAQWVPQRLNLSYTETPNGPILPPSFTFQFEDTQTQAIPWQPAAGTFSPSISLNNQMQWVLTFKSAVAPPEDVNLPSTGPDSVYPYWLQSVEDTAAITINGVMEIDDLAPNGTLVGFSGKRVMPMVAGYYQTSVKSAPFAIFKGKLYLNGNIVPGTVAGADHISWSNLDTMLQQRLGLPKNGTLHFDPRGNSGRIKGTSIAAYRLTASAAIDQIAIHEDLHQHTHRHILALKTSLADQSLNIYGLLPLTPYVQNAQGAWGDEVQAAVLNDMSTIMNSFVSSDIWGLLFPNTPQPTLSGKLAEVANSAVPGVTDPTAWYKSLGTAVMTQGMAGGADENCKNMNGPRAGAWLREQVANSAVYQAHAQLLFQYEWANLNPSINDYLNDQIVNNEQYQTIIATQVAASIADIRQNVAVDSSSPPDLIKTLTDQVQAAGDFAQTAMLYWAFAYYTYNTAPAILANIALQMSINTGGTDGTALSRLFQQNITVLTSLDPSGFFARQYNSTINTFLATNILPSMYGFTGDTEDFSLIKEYLQTFVNQNINNEDQQIAQAAAQIQNILNDENADKILQDSITALRTFSGIVQDAMALPYIAQKWSTWFSQSYPKFAAASNLFGSLLIGGISTMCVFNLIQQYKSWDKLTAAQRTQIVLDSVQLGLQIVSAVVKRGIRIYAIFNVDGMTFWQRSGAISRIMIEGEATQLNQGLMEISSTTARWLGDTAGVMEMRQEVAMLMTIGENDLEQVSWTVRIFGKNLDEFIATRLGPVLILAGIGLSIYFMITGETGVALASDIINVISGSLTLFSMVGGWLIEGGIIAAEGIMASVIAVAGPLAIVAALVGLGLMIYMLFQKQPDPVKEFVDNYVRPAGFYVSSACSSIDYVIPYALSEGNKLLMLGFSLAAAGQVLVCNPDGSIALGNQSNLPECVWKTDTDSLGMSQIATLVQPAAAKGPVGVMLSLMSDYSVSFQPRMTPAAAGATNTAADITVLTQTWLSAPIGNATTTNNDTALVSLGLTLQPVFPDTKGNYAPAQAKGYLVQQGTSVSYSDGNSGTQFTLNMEGIAPNFVKMADMTFYLNTTPLKQQTFGPSFGLTPSTPLSYSAISGLPDFLSFDVATGTLAPNGGKALTAMSQQYQIAMSNPVGSGSANFTITVKAPSGLSV
ncbi:hypothetical protein ACFJIV_05605 [Mucilaginibacter sp. UC70_90]